MQSRYESINMQVLLWNGLSSYLEAPLYWDRTFSFMTILCFTFLVNTTTAGLPVPQLCLLVKKNKTYLRAWRKACINSFHFCSCECLLSGCHVTQMRAFVARVLKGTLSTFTWPLKPSLIFYLFLSLYLTPTELLLPQHYQALSDPAKATVGWQL